MTVGIRMRQRNSVKVIDDRFSNLALVAKGSFVTNQYDTDVWAPQSPSRRYVRVTGTNPVIALRCNNGANYGGGGRSRRVDRGGGVFDFYFSVPQSELPPYVTTTIEYFIFDITPPNQTGFGLVIRNRLTNAIVFDSRHRYMKVLGFVARTATFDYNQTRRWVYDFPSSSLAVIQSQMPLRMFDFGSGTGGSEGYTMRTVVSVNTVTVIEGKEWEIFGNLVTPWIPTNGFAMLVIDTTGL